MTNTITITVKTTQDDLLLPVEAVSLLLGVEPEAINALPTSDGRSLIPRLWIKRGKRRSAEARAHTGSDALLDSLRYWARKDHDADLDVVYA